MLVILLLLLRTTNNDTTTTTTTTTNDNHNNWQLRGRPSRARGRRPGGRAGTPRTGRTPDK